MRACEGCRRRKIKCDAATTNTWPCSACNRLKLQCIPPTMIDSDFSGAEHVIDSQNASSYHFVNAGAMNAVQSQKQSLDYGPKPSYGPFQNNRQIYQPPLAHYSANTQFYPPDNPPRSYESLYQTTNSAPVDGANSSPSFYASEMAPLARTTSETSEHESSTAKGLSEALGELKIDESGIGRQLIDPCAKSQMLTLWKSHIGGDPVRMSRNRQHLCETKKSSFRRSIPDTDL